MAELKDTLVKGKLSVTGKIKSKGKEVATTDQIPDISGKMDKAGVDGNVTFGAATANSNRTATINGKVVINPSYNTAQNSYNEGIRINKASNGWANVTMGGNANETAGKGDGIWLVGRRGENGSKSGLAGDFTIENNGSTGTGLTLPANGNAPKWNGTDISLVGHTHTKSQITDFAHNHDDRYYTESEIDAKLAGNAHIVWLEENGSTTAGKWLAKTSKVSALVDGQLFLYKIAVDGASTTTLEITTGSGSLGAKTIYRSGTSKLTTHFGIGNYVLLAYNELNTCFRVVNFYDTNNYAYMRQYRLDSATANNAADLYPLLARRTLTNTDAYVTDYSNYRTDVYINGSTGALNAVSLSENGTALSDKYQAKGNYLTAHQSLAGYATQSWVEGKGYLTSHQNISGKLDKSGGTMTGNLKLFANDKDRGLFWDGNDVNTNALSNQFLMLGSAIRFGAYGTWDWNAWAGLKYTNSSKTISLGIADNKVFNANSAQSGGTIEFPGVSTMKLANGTYTVSPNSDGSPVTVYLPYKDGTLARLEDIPSLSGYATESWVNNKGYLTSHQSLTNYATKSYVDTAVSNLVNSAPGTLDTLKELADALGNDANFATTVSTEIGKKQDKITSSNKLAYSLISGTPTIPTTLPASDVYAWAKAATKPSYAWDEITDKPTTFTPSSHTHTKSQITDFPTSLPANGGTSTDTNNVVVADIRGATRAPSYFNDKSMKVWFNNSGTPTSDWYSGIHVKGWTKTDYYAWELSSGSTTSTDADNKGRLWYRTGAGSSWGDWKKVAWTSDLPGSVSKTAAGLCPALPNETSTTKYLRQDGTWQVPPDTNTTYSAATTQAAGLMSAADKTKLDGIASGANAYSLPTASSSTKGGIRLNFTTNATNRNYKVQVDSNGDAYVNVPWSDTNTTYNFSGTTFYSGKSDTAEHNANNAVSNGHYYYSSNGPATTLGASTADGALYVQSYSDSWVGQIAQDYRNGRLFVRGKNNGAWQAWKRIAMYDELPTDTWRPIADDLVTDKDDWSLSAAQGVVLKGEVDQKLSLSGGTMTGNINMGGKDLRSTKQVRFAMNQGTDTSHQLAIMSNNTEKKLHLIYVDNANQTTELLGSLALAENIPSLSGYATQSWVEGKGYLTSYTEQYTGTVKKVNNTSPDANGNVSLTIPAAANNGKITINQGGTKKGEFTVNQSGNTTIDLDAGGGGGKVNTTERGTVDLWLVGVQDSAADGQSVKTVCNYDPSDTSDLQNGAKWSNYDNRLEIYGDLYVSEYMHVGNGVNAPNIDSFSAKLSSTNDRFYVHPSADYSATGYKGKALANYLYEVVPGGTGYFNITYCSSSTASPTSVSAQLAYIRPTTTSTTSSSVFCKIVYLNTNMVWTTINCYVGSSKNNTYISGVAKIRMKTNTY